MDLLTTIALRADAQAQFDAALEAVCATAMRAGAVDEVARLQGYRRELEILRKQEFSFISHGRAEARSDAPAASSAAMTPAALPDAK